MEVPTHFVFVNHIENEIFEALGFVGFLISFVVLHIEYVRYSSRLESFCIPADKCSCGAIRQESQCWMRAVLTELCKSNKFEV